MDTKLRRVNVEPLMFLLSSGFGMWGTLFPPVFTYKQCLDMVPGEHDLCRDLGTKGMEDENMSTLLNEVQAMTARYLILNTLASAIPSIIIAVFVGSWCDKYGRKVPLVVATAGSALAIGLAMLCIAVDAMPSTVLILSSLIRGATGSMLVVHCASFAMISDIVAATSGRPNATLFTVRVGIASGISALGATAGSFVGGILMGFFNSYAYVYSVACACASLAFLYAVFILQETLPCPKSAYAKIAPIAQPVVSQTSTEKKPLETIHEESGEHENAQTVDGKGFLQTLYEKLKEAFEVFTKKRPGRRQAYLIITILSFLLLSAFEPMGVYNLYVKRPPLSLSDSNYSFLMTMSMALMVIAKMVIAVFLKRCFNMSDYSLVVIGVGFMVASKAMLVAAAETWMLFAAAVVNGISSVYIVGGRSYFGSLVDASEKGRLYAAVFTVDEIGPLLSTLIVNNIYAVTLDTYPATVFLISTCVATLVFFIHCGVLIDSKRRKEDPEENSEEEKTPLLTKKENCTV